MVFLHRRHRVGKMLTHLTAVLGLLLLVHLKNELAGGGGSLHIVVIGQGAEHVQLAAGGAFQKLAQNHWPAPSAGTDAQANGRRGLSLAVAAINMNFRFIHCAFSFFVLQTRRP